MDHILLAKISTLSILVPMALCIWAYKQKAEGYLRLFLFFFLFGFFIDSMGWYQYKTQSTGGHFDLLRRSYALIEALFFLCFISKSTAGLTSQISTKAIFWMIPCWVILELLIPLGSFEGMFVLDAELAYFQAIYRVLLTFLSGFSLLQLLERNDIDFTKPIPWFLFGIFVYNLATFFMMILQRVELGEALWYMHNVMNLITYLLFSLAFITHIKAHRRVSTKY